MEFLFDVECDFNGLSAGCIMGRRILRIINKKELEECIMQVSIHYLNKEIPPGGGG